MRLTILIGTLLATLAGCTAPSPDPGLADLHAMVVEPDGTLLIATHDGLIEAVPDGGSWRLATRGAAGTDLMGLARGEDGVLWAGGHPPVRAPSDPKHLGLYRSQDDGRSWESVSLFGQADLHALTTIPGSGDVLTWNQGLTSWDGAAWSAHPAPAPVLSLARNATHILAGTTQGIWSSPDAEAWTRIDAGLPPVDAVAVAGDVLFAHVREDRDGAGLMSHDGATWNPIPEPALADEDWVLVFAVDPDDPDHVFAGRYGGKVHESKDRGATWTQIIG